MAAASVVSRVAVPTAVTASVTTGLAVAVNCATGSQRSPWLWLAVALLTVASFVATMWLYQRQRIGAGDVTVPSAGIDIADVEAVNLHARRVRSLYTGVSVVRSRFHGDIDLENVEVTLGDASHPQ
ncbi:hypothetical protein ACWDSJ_06900 [Nocardia sp. NPDC003482]